MVFMLRPKQMLAATDCRTETTVIAAPSIVFHFKGISGRADCQDNWFWFPV